MDEVLLKQVVRQLKFLNFWITFFGVLFIITFIIAGIALFKVATYANNSVKKLESIQQETAKTLNVKQQLCASKDLGSILRAQTDIC